MLNQSFSVENFLKIFDIQNRKGVNLEISPKIKKITDEIKLLNKQIKKTNNKKNRNILYEKRKILKEKRLESLKEEFSKITKIYLNKNFKFDLKKIKFTNKKPIYKIEEKPASYFAAKQIQYNLSKLYKVKQSDRDSILKNVFLLLNDTIPKFVIRTDIKECYESIPTDKLVEKLNNDNLLSFLSKKLIKKLLEDYQDMSKSKKGVPRGVGISAYLSEIYLRKIDEEIKKIPDLVFYARYVDDIILILVPSKGENEDTYMENKLDEIKKITEGKGLDLNKKKTISFNLSCDELSFLYFDFLGYSIFFEKNKPGKNKIKTKLQVVPTNSKMNKYKRKIDLIFNSYNYLKYQNKKKASRLLIRRIRFLTGNTRLKNNKKNILVGIYHTNKNVTHPECFKYLDFYLKEKVLTLEKSLQNRILKCNFTNGFKNKDDSFSPFTTQELNEILSIFKNI